MAIAGVVSKKGEDISLAIVRMLTTMTHAKSSIAVFSLNGEILSTEMIRSPEQGNTKELISVGYCGYPHEKEEHAIKTLEREDGRIFIVGKGRTYFDQAEDHIKTHNFAVSTIENVTHVIEEEHIDLFKRLVDCLSRLHGFFSLAVLSKERIIVARDSIGVEPLYWGLNEDCYAIASERKALWRIGINDAKAFPRKHSIDKQEWMYLFPAIDFEEAHNEKHEPGLCRCRIEKYATASHYYVSGKTWRSRSILFGRN